MNLLIKAERIRRRTGSLSGSSAILGIPKSTLSRWLRERPQSGKKNEPKHEPAKGQWMQTLHQQQAHFFIHGQPACAAKENGVKLMPGDRWMPWDRCVRQCQRCMHHAKIG